MVNTPQNLNSLDPDEVLKQANAALRFYHLVPKYTLDSLRKAMTSHDDYNEFLFGLIEEAKIVGQVEQNSFLQVMTNYWNICPMDELGGMTPWQMMMVFELSKEHRIVPEMLVENAALADVAACLEYVEDKPLILTSKLQRLKNADILALNQLMRQPNQVRLKGPYGDFDLKVTENRLPTVWLLKNLLLSAGLLKINKGRITTTKRGREWLVKSNIDKYWELMDVWLHKFNWPCLVFYKDVSTLEMMQDVHVELMGNLVAQLHYLGPRTAVELTKLVQTVFNLELEDEYERRFFADFLEEPLLRPMAYLGLLKFDGDLSEFYIMDPNPHKYSLTELGWGWFGDIIAEHNNRKY